MKIITDKQIKDILMNIIENSSTNKHTKQVKNKSNKMITNCESK